jgi:hypothetical protein
MLLPDVNQLADKYEPHFFTRQLNRFLAENERRLFIRDDGTGPHFWGLLNNLEKSSIGAIDIYARTDIAENIDTTLACDLIMDDGIVSVASYWSAYKHTRAIELISSLLLPIFLKGLHEKTHLRLSEKESEPLLSDMDSGLKPAVGRVFKLAKHPSAISPSDDSEKRKLHKEISKLAHAQEVAKEDLTGQAIWNRLREVTEAAEKS